MREKRKKAKLVLKDGSFFEGFLFGSDTTASGEAVFNTGMAGYPEAMTDPSYFGQILIFTYPLIGNYGIPSAPFESDHIQPKGIVVANYSESYSHWQAAQSLENWMKQQNIPGICGIDTRAVTKKLREQGTMLAQITTGEASSEWYDPNAANVLPYVSCAEPVFYGKNKGLNILLLDCGAKAGIVRSLLAREAQVTRVPHDEDISTYQYDGVIISNGPGDPKHAKAPIATIKKLLSAKDAKPLFGVCLGSQLLALAAGADTTKLPYGHRSQNQPCRDLETSRCYVTSQNHGFAIQEKSLPNQWNVWFRNINDNTVEGIKHARKPFSAVQFHPEASPGPTDTNFLFDTFLDTCKIYASKKY